LKRIIPMFIAVVLLLSVSVLALGEDINTKVSLQGRLTDQNGIPINDVKTFDLDINCGGDSWSDSYTAQVEDGLFTILMNTGNLNFDDSCYLSVTVDGESLGSVEVASAPTAYRADEVGQLTEDLDIVGDINIRGISVIKSLHEEISGMLLPDIRETTTLSSTGADYIQLYFFKDEPTIIGPPPIYTRYVKIFTDTIISGGLTVGSSLNMLGNPIYGTESFSTGQEFTIWGFSPSYPNLGIFYKEANPNDYIAIAPHPSTNTNPALKIEGGGAMTAGGSLNMNDNSITDIYSISCSQVGGCINSADILPNQVGDSQLFNGGTWNLNSDLTFSGSDIKILNNLECNNLYADNIKFKNGVTGMKIGAWVGNTIALSSCAYGGRIVSYSRMGLEFTQQPVVTCTSAEPESGKYCTAHFESGTEDTWVCITLYNSDGIETYGDVNVMVMGI